MNRHSYVEIPALCWHSSSLYRDAARNWTGTGFLYLFVLLAVSWALVMANLWFGFDTFCAVQLPDLLKQVPEVRVSKGRVFVDVDMPFFMRDENNETLAVIDTTGTITTIDDPRVGEAKVLLTATQVYLRKSKYETRTFDLSKVENFKLSRDQVTVWITWVGLVGIPVMFFFMLGFSFIYRMLQAVVYGAIGLGMCSVLNAELPFVAVMRLSVIAVTPSIILSTVVDLAGIAVPFAPLVWFVMTLAFLFRGVAAAKDFDKTDGAEAPAAE